MSKQVGREQMRLEQDSIWAEIVAEQKKLKNGIHPHEKPMTEKKTKKEPFSTQTSYFGKSPFDHLLMTEAPRDVYYDISNLDNMLGKRRSKSQSHFGRRLDDTDREILNKTDALDVMYPNMADQWLKTKKSSGSVINLSRLELRRSAYDYMPQTCGGPYAYLETKKDY